LNGLEIGGGSGHRPATSSPRLVAFKGPAGSGKSTLSRALSRQLGWPVIDKDDVRDFLDDSNPGLAYDVMFNIARRQLLQDLNVICDSPLSSQKGYDHAIHIADETKAALVVVECLCPDDAVWRDRINARKALNLPSHHATDWDIMQAHRAGRADPARYAINHPYLVVNTLEPIADLCAQVVAWLEQR